MGCWPWMAQRDPKGRGRFMWSETRKPRFAHRVAYEFCQGAIPSGLLVCHHCDNPTCCNPAHLFVGTNKDNTQDMVRKGRARGAQGEKHRSARLTADIVGQIRAAVGTTTQIAERFGIASCHVTNIRAGRKWKHLLP